MTALPDAEFLLLSSRLIPGLDGGYTVAAVARAQMLAEAGGRPHLLTVDPGTPADHAAHRAEFARRGMTTAAVEWDNLFDDALADPGWLRRAAVPGAATPGVEYRVVTDAAGTPAVSIPVVRDPDWHLAEAAVVVHGDDGDRVVTGFGGLYRAWLDEVVARVRRETGDPDRDVVVVCESRQLGELLVPWRAPGVRLVHTVHNSHLPAPYDDPEAPLIPLWRRWLEHVDRYDAVLWPTAAQRDEIARRFGDPGTFHVVPNAVAPGSEPPPAEARDPRRVVMLNRLADQKRVDVAVRAWPRVRAEFPEARLDVYGDGPLRGQLQALIDELGLADSVVLHGATQDRDAVFDAAALFVSTSAFEGQGLSILEALARGLPVVATDVRYGPGEAVGDAGILVPSADVDAVAQAVIALLADDDRRAELSIRARAAALRFAPDAVLPALVSSLADAVAGPAR